MRCNQRNHLQYQRFSLDHAKKLWTAVMAAKLQLRTVSVCHKENFRIKAFKKYILKNTAPNKSNKLQFYFPTYCVCMYFDLYHVEQ